MYFLKKDDLPMFIQNLIASQEVIGPKAKDSRFIFDLIKDPGELRLDYDITVLPPKKFFFPPRQDLLKYANGQIEECLNPGPKIFFGLHPYDIKAISILDTLFGQKKEDWYYLANRKVTTIVGLNVQRISQNAFFESMGAATVTSGYDLFMTDIGEGFVFEVGTARGKNILKFGNFVKATDGQIHLRQESRKAGLNSGGNSLNELTYPLELVAKRVRASFNSPVWEDLAKRCFSCGSCNMVCPTCYCFDVQDLWNLDQESSATRFRTWDGCLVEGFAEISIQGGIENFRQARSKRYKHRIMRKFSYLNLALGSPACVGCGRCVSACTADIANPVKVITRLMEE